MKKGFKYIFVTARTYETLKFRLKLHVNHLASTETGRADIEGFRPKISILIIASYECLSSGKTTVC